MKPLLFLIAFLAAATPALHAQDTLFTKHAPVYVFDKDYYLAKSQHLKTKAWSLLACGTLMCGIGMLVYNNNQYATLDQLDVPAGAALIATAGAGLMIGSIPAFISSAHYKKKSMKVALSPRFSRGAPGLAVRLNF